MEVGALGGYAAVGPLRRRRRAALALLAAALACRCSSPTRPTGSGPQIFVGAGDIANHDILAEGAEATARLIESIPGPLTVFTAGDNAYPGGSKADFLNNYDPTWGRLRNITFPTPGNHDYDDRTNSPVPYYYDYFGARAGIRGLGYYGFTLGNWKILSLNSEVDVSAGSAQVNWLRDQLASGASPRSSPQPSPRCTLAIWHKPLFSSGGHGNNGRLMRDVWKVLYDAGADVVVTGHDHLYERFRPQDADGQLDVERGMAEFIVGTGGGERNFFTTLQPNSDARLDNVYGVLKLTLYDGGYAWEFLPTTGGSFDMGSGACH